MSCAPITTLHFTCGKMAAGKTTLARALAVGLTFNILEWYLGRSAIQPIDDRPSPR